VQRSFNVVVEALDENGEPVRLEANDPEDPLLARVIQHETDHLDGILFIDRISEDLRKDALGILRDQALGLIPTPRPGEYPQKAVAEDDEAAL
jgi:peptide deformylase